MGPTGAFLLFIGGMLGIYCELVWPGRLIPGLAGSGAALAGAYLFFRPPLNAAGLVLLVSGAALVGAEIIWRPYYVLGSFGTVALTAGFCLLHPPPSGPAPAAAIPISLAFGAVSTLLAASAKRARRNKRAGWAGR